MTECKNCGASYYRRYEDDERTEMVEHPATLYIHFSDTWLCVLCGREEKEGTHEVINEGNPDKKDVHRVS